MLHIGTALMLAQATTPTETAMLDTPPGSLPIVDDARWSASLTSHSWWALVFWFVLLVVLQIVAWPLVRRVFHRFPDRGWGFSRLLALVIAGYLVWLPASIGVMEFRAVWCAIAVAITAAACWAGGSAWRRRSTLATSTSGASLDVAASPKSWLSSIGGPEIAFWAVFGLFLAYRFINHDSYHPIWGGEKPMEFAQLNAILRSPSFPPSDAWYAGGYINYYYYGAYLVAFMIKLTGIPSEIAFNLAQPTMMAILASCTWSVGAALGSMASRSRVGTIVGGISSVVLMVISGNLVVASRLVSSISGTRVPLADFGWFWDPTRIVPYTIDEFPYFTGTYADLHAHGIALPMTVTLVGMCLALVMESRSLARVARQPRADLRAAIGLGGRLMLMALLFATLYMTNAWDMPTYAAFIAITMVMATSGVSRIIPRVIVIGASGLAVAIATVALIQPFRSHYVALYGSVDEVRSPSPLITILGHFGLFFLVITWGLAWYLARRMERPPRIVQPLVLGAAVLTTLLLRWVAVERSQDWIDITGGLVVLVPVTFLMFASLLSMPDRLDARLPGRVGFAAIIAGWIGVLWALGDGKTALALFGGLATVTAVQWLAAKDRAVRFTMGLLTAGLCVGGAMELVYLVDGLQGGDFYRMNTVFKFYMAVWATLALGSGSLIAMMASGVGAASLSDSLGNLPEIAPTEPVWAPDRELGWSTFGLTVSVLAIVASLAFPVFSTSARLDQQFPQDGRTFTLNALDWMSYGQISATGNVGVVPLSFAEDRAVLEWFNADVPGLPVIAEANIGIYRCAGDRISIHTGLPTIVGWSWHEQQQRGEADLSARLAALYTLYTSTNPEDKMAVINQYNVEYVVVGNLERYYPAAGCEGAIDNTAGVAAFQSLVGSQLEVAFQSGETVVYRVIGR